MSSQTWTVETYALCIVESMCRPIGHFCNFISRFWKPNY